MGQMTSSINLPRLSLFTALGAALLIFCLHFFQWVDFHESDAIDLRFRLRGQRPARPDIVLVMVDDASIAAVGQWPWPRRIYASLIDVLQKYGPRLILFDILFTEQSPNPEDDRIFGEAVGQAGNVAIPFYYSEERGEVFQPTPLLKDAAKISGYVNVLLDADGYVRRVRMSEDLGGGSFFHMTVRAAHYDIEGNEIAKKIEKMPVDDGQALWIDYPGNSHSFKAISFGELIQKAGLGQDEFLRQLFSNAYILVGHTATGTTDIKPTPFSNREIGLAIQASALHTVLQGRSFRVIHPLGVFVLLILMAFLVREIVRRLKPLYALAALLGLLTFYAGLNLLLFRLYWILPLFVPSVVALFCFIAGIFIRQIEILLARERIDQEIRAAGQIQQHFLPAKLPEFPGLDIASSLQFAKTVGGDLFDWWEDAQKSCVIVLGDVSGKGMPAALYMAKAMSNLESIGREKMEPGPLCEKLNQKLLERQIATVFLTFLCLAIDPQKRMIRYASAGHEPMILGRPGDSAKLIREPQGLALGMFDDSRYETGMMKYQPGDLLALYTDGVKEQRNLRREEFGYERLAKAVQEAAEEKLSAEKSCAHIKKQMERFSQGAPAHDDQTLICVRL